ncbi:hypothetical protein [Lacticaseibacillus sp. GG6-2]
MLMIVALLTVGMLLYRGKKGIWAKPTTRIWGFVGCAMLWADMLWQNLQAHQLLQVGLDALLIVILAWDIYKQTRALKATQDDKR